MESFFALLVSTFLGIIGSLLSWYILFHILVPQVKFSNKISRVPIASNPYKYRYRIKMANYGKRDIIDLEIFIILRLKGINSNSTKNVHVYYPKPSNDRIPLLPKKNNKKHLHKIIDIDFYSLVNEITYFDYELNSVPILEYFFSKTKGKSSLEVIVFGYDAFSGTRKVFISPRYYNQDIMSAKFERTSLKINSLSYKIVEVEDRNRRRPLK